MIEDPSKPTNLELLYIYIYIYLALIHKVQHKRSVGIKIGLSIRKVKRKPPRSKSLTNHEKKNILLKRKGTI
jgi:hypothetical protein